MARDATDDGPSVVERRDENDTDLMAAVAAAVIDAELRTGTREPDHAAAKAHILVRVARGTAGVLTIVVGVALTVLPGPGVLFILAGLGILAVDYPFAARLRDRLLTTGATFAGRAAPLLKRLLVGIGLVLLVVVLLLAALVVIIVRAIS